MSYYDDDDPFDDDLDDEEGFGEEDGFSEIDFDEEEDSEVEYSEDKQPEEGATVKGFFGEPEGGDEAGSDPFAELSMAGSPQDNDLAWRETYFILFSRNERPTLTQVEAAIGESGRRITMERLDADEDGLFQSVLVHAPEDNASLEISYEEGEAVMEQSAELAKMLRKQIDGQQFAQLLRADARLDVMHFERMEDDAPLEEETEDDIALEALNPATLISVVQTLATLTGGLPIDPAAGEVMI